MNLTHGTQTAYAHGCRCNQCREANALRQRAYRQTRNARLAVEAAGNPVPDMAWADDAACRECDPNLWFPAGGHGVRRRLQRRPPHLRRLPPSRLTASNTPSLSPSRAACGGGLDPDERRLLRRRRRYAERKVTA